MLVTKPKILFWKFVKKIQMIEWKCEILWDIHLSPNISKIKKLEIKSYKNLEKLSTDYHILDYRYPTIFFIQY